MRALAILLAVAVFCASSAQAQDQALRRADVLIKEGKPRAALKLLAPLAGENAGNAEYHYLAGIAAIDTGELDFAVSSLKEALRIRPELVQARAELGRARLLMGDYLAAYFEFEAVKRANPPPEVLAGIDSYVDRLHQAVTAQRKRFGGALSFGFGYDSNVNTATSAQQITLPLFGGIVATLDAAGQAQSDAFYALGAEVGGYYPLTANAELVGGASARAKLNADVKDFDYSTAGLAGGVRFDLGANQFGVIGNYEELIFDHLRTRETAGVNADWRRVVHPLVELTVFGQFSRLTYPRERLRDVDRQVVGVGLIPAAFGKRLTYMPPLAAVYFGEERTVNSGVPHLGHELWGARSTLLFFFNSRTAVFAGASYERREYGGPDPLFLVTRLDRQFDLTAGVSYGLSKDWTLLPALSYTDNRSSLEVFQYRRTAVTLSVRYAF
jgi:tetratricopeptide (TPR) repeat protein